MLFQLIIPEQDSQNTENRVWERQWGDNVEIVDKTFADIEAKGDELEVYL